MDLIGQRVGNYVIERPLKKGGMGSVYVARHPAIGKRVAVKFLDTPSHEPEHGGRFLDEARITASLDHPNIINVYDFGELDGRFYYVMELLIGRDLGEVIAVDRLHLDQIYDYLIQICRGLEAAHDRGIVHRDLKPANVFIVDGQPTLLKLMDFGVAKVLAQDVGKTNHGHLLGTPLYMAPEQALGDIARISLQTDLYAAGVIAYELLSGKPPFEHESAMMLLMAHVHADFAPLRRVAPHVPPQLCGIVERCLSKDPGSRPRSAAELASEIEWAIKHPAAAALPQSAQVVSLIPPTERAEPRVDANITAEEPTFAEGSPDLSLDDNDRSVLKKLIQRMRRRGDLPAFVANVGDVNRKADFEGKYSADQLSEAILKDHALTAKLLRVVNTNYLKRFGGKIYSVQQAIVILGFEQVRSLALSIAVFDKEGAGPNSGRIADSAVHALVSGELARLLAGRLGMRNEEESTVCAMFCKLGRHLALVYLPEQFERVRSRAERESIHLERAAEKELGIGFQKLGIGVAEQWHLPSQLLEAMGEAPKAGSRPTNGQQQLAFLAHFSNELCELVATGLSSTDDPRLKRLLNRFENFVALDKDEVPALLAQVEESFHARYATLLGTKAKSSRFLTHLPELSPEARGHAAGTTPHPGSPSRARLEQTSTPGSKRSVRHKERSRRRVQGVLLGQPQKEDQERTASDTVGTSLEQIRELLVRQRQPQQALSQALGVFSRHLNLPRVVAFKPSGDGTELIVTSAVGDDALALSKELRLTLNSSLQANDVFSKAFNGRKDIFVRDSYSERSAAQVPRRYYEVFGSPAFAILSCQDERGRITLLLADVADPSGLPDRDELGQLGELKALIAAAVAA